MLRRLLALSLPLLAVAAVAAPPPEKEKAKPGAHLSGEYARDKGYFFPSGKNDLLQTVYLDALAEGVEQKFKLKPELSVEENLAAEYEATSFSARKMRMNHAGYAYALAKLGMWKDAAGVLRQASGIRGFSAVSWGNRGVAEAALENYQESLASFDKCLQIEPDYFSHRPLQKRVYEAAKQGRRVQPETAAGSDGKGAAAP